MAFALDGIANAHPQCSLIRWSIKVFARVARGADDCVKLLTLKRAVSARRQMCAHSRVLSMAERAVEKLAEQFLALLAVHFM